MQKIQDKRTGIAPGQIIVLKDTNNGILVDFIIEKEIGRGGSCIVYSATYKQNDITRHCRLKEFYPADNSNYYYDISRNGTELKIADAAQEQFESKKERFLEGVKKQILFYESIAKTRNQTTYVGGIYEGGNTLFYTMLCDQGVSYDCVEDKSLIDILKTGKAIAQAVQSYHNYEVSGEKNPILHLDIKPQNIFVLQESREVIKLFDFDSVVNKNELDGSNAMISGSEGYMPYEVRDASKHYLISEKSDIYSIGAIVFERIVGRRVTMQDEDNGFVDIEYNNPLFANVSVAIFKKMDKFFEKTCLGRMKQRYSNVEELIDAFDELLEYAKPIECFINKFLPSATSTFIGREREMEQIDANLSDGNHVILSGLAGIGKTELAIRYANLKEQNKEFRCNFTTFNKNILETILELDFNNFAQYCKKNKIDLTNKESVFAAKLDILSKDGANNLLIIDNMDAENHSDIKTKYFDRLVSCGIKIIFTTRTYYDDSCIKISEIKDDMLLNLFDYDKTNIETIKEIIKLVEGHSLAVTLVSRSIKESLGTLTPEMVLEELKKGNLDSEKLGSVISNKRDTSYNELGISASLYKHIRKLFEFAKLSNSEKECLKNLSLFKSGIDIDAFMEFKGADCLDTIKNINKKGWLKFDKDNSTVSIHSIIRFLIPNELGINDASIISYCLNMLSDYATTNIEEIKKVITIAIIISDNELIDAKLRIKLYDAIVYKSCYWFCAEQMHRKWSIYAHKEDTNVSAFHKTEYINKRYAILHSVLEDSLRLKESNNFDEKEVIKACINICLFEWATMKRGLYVNCLHNELEEYLVKNTYWLKAMRIAKNTFDETDEVWAIIYQCYGNMYRATRARAYGHPQKARDYYKKALELLPDIDDNLFARAELMLRIGECETDKLEYDKSEAALVWFKNALEIFEKILPETHFLRCFTLARISETSGGLFGFSFYNKWYQNISLLPSYISYKIAEKRFLASYSPIYELETNIDSLSCYSANLPQGIDFKPYNIYGYEEIAKYQEHERFFDGYIKLLKNACKLLHEVKNHPKSMYKGKKVEQCRKKIYQLIEQLEKHMKEVPIERPWTRWLLNQQELLSNKYLEQFTVLYEWLNGNFDVKDPWAEEELI